MQGVCEALDAFNCDCTERFGVRATHKTRKHQHKHTVLTDPVLAGERAVLGGATTALTLTVCALEALPAARALPVWQNTHTRQQRRDGRNSSRMCWFGR